MSRRAKILSRRKRKKERDRERKKEIADNKNPEQTTGVEIN
jgi:hypothetical protein